MRKLISILLSVCIISTMLVIPTTIKASSVVESAIAWAISMANDNSHGYSQSNRWGPNYDCSSFVISAFRSVGIDTGSATYTGNMRSQFTQHGFQWIPWSQIGSMSNLQRGDILLNEVSHTEIYLGNGQNVGAHSDRGYPQTGDQTGTEISVSGYYNHPWDGILRYVEDRGNPSVAGAYWGNMTDTTFRPVVQISNPTAVKNVRFAVWTKEDQSDLRWYDSDCNATGGYFRDINFSDFCNKKYICHVYVYAYNGNVQCIKMSSLDKNDYSKIKIIGAYWGNMTDTTFRPVIEIENPTAVKNVRYAVWTTEDQSDLKWYDSDCNTTGGYFTDIKYSDFKNQYYMCHIYVFGNDGSTRVIILSTFDTYNVEGGFENATGGVGSVTVSGFAFDRSDLDEKIYLHCYLKDSKGKATFLGAVVANEERTDIDNKYSVGSQHGFSKTFTTSLTGTYTIEVSAINVGGGKDVTFLGAKTVTITQPTVHFDSCGGTSCESMKVTNTQPYGELPTSIREGYTFEGWYTEKTAGHKVSEDDIVALTNNQTLYAHWTCNHDNYTTVTIKATCEEDGENKYICRECGFSYTEPIKAKGHQYKDIVVNPTCTVKGYTIHTCEKCGETYTDSIIEERGHNYSKQIIDEATCTSDGLMIYTCKECNETKTEIISAKGHDYAKQIVVPTCDKEGYTLHKCKTCGFSYKDSYVDKLEHNYVTKVEREATCTEEGLTKYICSACGDSYFVKTPVVNHKYIDSIVEPTFTDLGYTLHICIECGISYRDNYKEQLEKTTEKPTDKTTEKTTENLTDKFAETSSESPENTTEELTSNKKQEKVSEISKKVNNEASNNNQSTTTIGSAKKDNSIVNVEKTKIKKATRTKNNKKIKISLKKIRGATGYLIKYSTERNFKKKFTKTVTTKKPNKTIKKLKSNKVYYVKARVYKKVLGRKKYGEWSRVKKIKVK